jgi:hypothetical protein
MTATMRLGFTKPSTSLVNNIYLPRYYDPQLGERLERLGKTHRLKTLGSLIAEGHVSVHYGHDIGKHTYGQGRIPYVRTSDIATWEIVSAPKQTVGVETYEVYAAKQDVRAGDIFFIRDGLYLIGRVAMVTEADLPLIHQSHLIRLRVADSSPVPRGALLAALSTPVVLRQVRGKQFTAGIIDKIENRYRELVLPLPRTDTEVADLANRVEGLVRRRVELRERLKTLPSKAQGVTVEGTREAAAPALDSARLGYTLASTEVHSNVFIPKYYNPGIRETLKGMDGEYELRTIGELEAQGILNLSTGIEVGKLAYGTGDVPFVRTSDLANWELAGQPKQRISLELYESFRKRVDLRPDDILLVRDGTYLIGTSAILTKADAQALYAGGIYRIRSLKPEELDPYLLLVLLNTAIVNQQIRAKQFTRDIIDTLGRRLLEVVLPIPKSPALATALAEEARLTVEERIRLRDEAKELVLDVEGPIPPADDEELELTAQLAV